MTYLIFVAAETVIFSKFTQDNNKYLWKRRHPQVFHEDDLKTTAQHDQHFTSQRQQNT